MTHAPAERVGFSLFACLAAEDQLARSSGAVGEQQGEEGQAIALRATSDGGVARSDADAPQ
jgi:hypothetical protein